MPKNKIFFYIIFLIISLINPAICSEREISLTFGVVPQFDPDHIYRTWDPILKELSKKVGVKIELKLFKSIPEFEKAFLDGKLDFAYMNPYHMNMAKKAKGYIPLIRDKSLLTGIIVVKRDAPYRSVTDLKNVIIAFPSPNAFAASLYLRAILTEKFKISFTPKYVKTHDNVYRHVAMGLAQAGGGVNKTFLLQPPEIKESLRILYETPGAAPHPIAVHPRVPKEIREAFVKNFIALSTEKNFADNFKNIPLSEPILADYVRDYQPLEKLKLEKYVILEEK